jgi:hypothetical protein
VTQGRVTRRHRWGVFHASHLTRIDGYPWQCNLAGWAPHDNGRAENVSVSSKMHVEFIPRWKERGQRWIVKTDVVYHIGRSSSAFRLSVFSPSHRTCPFFRSVPSHSVGSLVVSVSPPRFSPRGSSGPPDGDKGAGSPMDPFGSDVASIVTDSRAPSIVSIAGATAMAVRHHLHHMSNSFHTYMHRRSSLLPTRNYDPETSQRRSTAMSKPTTKRAPRSSNGHMPGSAIRTTPGSRQPSSCPHAPTMTRSCPICTPTARFCTCLASSHS